MKTVTATEFKAKCLALIEQVYYSGQPVAISKHGKVMASLVKNVGGNDRPWLKLRGKGIWRDKDPFAPVIKESEVPRMRYAP